jgi:hypothetical protein
MRACVRTTISLAAAVALLTAAGGAAGHGGSRSQGYVSSFSSLDPPVLGLLVNVFGPRNRMQVTNYSGKTVVILGVDHEPYLRLSGQKIDENRASPTAYLNASEPVPPTATEDARPRWRPVARGAAYSWHDHRINWEGAKPPPVVESDPTTPHLIFRWRIPATVEGKPFAINGFLGWAPTPSTQDDGVHWLLPALGAAAAVVVAATALALGPRARRARRQAL